MSVRFCTVHVQTLVESIFRGYAHGQKKKKDSEMFGNILGNKSVIFWPKTRLLLARDRVDRSDACQIRTSCVRKQGENYAAARSPGITDYGLFARNLEYCTSREGGKETQILTLYPVDLETL